MAPSTQLQTLPLTRSIPLVTKPTNPDGLVLEAWGQGFAFGALTIMIFITLCNLRRRVLLHKLILVELILGLFHVTDIFPNAPVYGWYLSATSIPLNACWSLHNVVAWMKMRSFVGRKTKIVYLTTLALAQPYWVLELYANFCYFNNINTLFTKTRPWEALCRDPWWIYSVCILLYNIRTQYSFTYVQLTRISPRFAIMLLAMILSIIFTIVDICAVTGAFNTSLPVGNNPFWKLSFVFKCLTDTVILDDFKTALDKLRMYNLSRIGDQSTNGVTNLSSLDSAMQRQDSLQP